MKSSPSGTGLNRWLWPAGAVLLSAALTACGGNIEPAGTSVSIDVDPAARSSPPHAEDTRRRAVAPVGSDPAAATLPARSHGTLLEGLPGAYAHQALRGYLEEEAVGADLASDHATADRLQLSAVIAATATIGQVNAALNQVGARIVSMQPGNSEVRLDLEAPGARPSTRDVATQLLATRAFEAIDGIRSAAVATPAAEPAPLIDPYAPAPVEDHQSPP